MNVPPSYILKLFRASQHYADLVEQSTAFIEDRLDYTEAIESVGSDNWAIYRWDNVVPMPPDLGVLLGDFIHNVRSALDHLVYALVLDNMKDPGNHTQFPIYDSEPGWINDVDERSPDRNPSPVEGVAPHHLDIIKESQPFRSRPKQRRSHPLMQLLRVSNVDKHRTLHVAQVRAAAPTTLRYEPSGYVAIMKRKVAREKAIVGDGVEIARVKFRVVRQAPPGTKVSMHISGPAQAAFGEPGRQLIVDLNDLANIHDFARKLTARLRPTPELLASLAEAATKGSSRPAI